MIQCETFDPELRCLRCIRLHLPCTRGMLDSSGCLRVGSRRRVVAAYNGRGYSYLVDALERMPEALRRTVRAAMTIPPRLIVSNGAALHRRLYLFSFEGGAYTPTALPAMLLEGDAPPIPPTPLRAHRLIQRWIAAHGSGPVRAEVVSSAAVKNKGKRVAGGPSTK